MNLKKYRKSILITLNKSLVEDLDTLARAGFTSRLAVIRSILKEGVRERVERLRQHCDQSNKRRDDRYTIDTFCDDWDVPRYKKKTNRD